ncbi:hypothetical protein [Zestomonas thermotolerans]|uniref:hypothetical protein n=1 Tax=Zestomonas thermotolerans TaxID=157784 RepID=UPI000486E27D|nr:hypothetical protein [Pseudomonas thermotolerans]
MRTLSRLLLLSAAVVTLSACTDEETEQVESSLCIYNTDPQAERCKPGQMAWFRPDGNQQITEQTALSVAAVYCDFNHQVMHNRAGVLCVFTDKRLDAVK